MMQGVSVSSLPVFANGGCCGAIAMLRSDLRLYRIHTSSSMDGPFLWHQCALRSYPFKSTRTKRMGSRVKATWLFKGNGKKMDANIERSEAANEDILIFFFQLDMETRIQYALNLEQYDAAQELRNKLAEIETEIIKQRDAKRGSSKSDAQDKAINLLRLRADLQKAIESENYAVAAELRDEISKLEAESLAASAKALAYENAQYAFRLGQKVQHKVFGYRAVICGMDPVCCESSSWMEIARVDKLPQGPNQPFYQVTRRLISSSQRELRWLLESNHEVSKASMKKFPSSKYLFACMRDKFQAGQQPDVFKVLVDVHADPNLLVAYVPEENLLDIDHPDKDRFDHPYISFLFYGMDTAGDFIPIKQLREKFNRPRYEVPQDTHDEDGDDNS